MKAANKTIVVTGAGSGIGRQLTIQLTQKGAKVLMADLSQEAMDETARLSGNISMFRRVVNVADRTAVEDFARQALQQGPVDGVINNAGIIQPFIGVNDLTYEQIERVMQVNFYGILFMTKAFLPLLLLRPEAHIVNVSSMGGFMPFPRQTVYGASKAAVKLFTEGLYAEMRNTKVKVSVVYPGAVDTHIMSNSGLSSQAEETEAKKKQPKMAMPADKAASTIINGMENNRYRILVGNDARLFDLLYRLSPRRAVHFIVKQMGKLGM